MSGKNAGQHPTTDTFKWPTLGEKVKTWEGTCDRCGETFPADTRINAVWSPSYFYISCQCSLRNWIRMEVS